MDPKIDLEPHGLLVGLKGSRPEEIRMIFARYLIKTKETFLDLSTTQKLNMFVHDSNQFI